MTDRPLPAYDGDAPDIFVSYSHADDAIVYPEIRRLQEEGYRVWYDEGIAPAESWSQELASAIDRSALFLFFVTSASVASRHCMNEVQFALGRNKRILAVHLEPTDLPGGLELALGATQAIYRHAITREAYEMKLRGALEGRAVRPSSPASRRRRSRWPIARALLAPILGIGILAGALSISIWLYFKPRTSDEALSIAITEPTFTDDQTEDLAYTLATEVSRELTGAEFCLVECQPVTLLQSVDNATYTLTSTLSTLSGSPRLDAVLIHNQEGRQVWSRVYEDADDISIAGVAHHLAIKTKDKMALDHLRRHPHIEPALSQNPTANQHLLDAEEMLRAMQLGEGGSWTQIRSSLELATAADDQFAFAYILLAESYAGELGYGQLDVVEFAPEARAAASKARKLAPDFPALKITDALIYHMMEWDLASAEPLYRECLDAPWFNAVCAMGLASIALTEGRLQEARKFGAIAYQFDDYQIEGQKVGMYIWYAAILNHLGEYERSLKVSTEAMALVHKEGPLAAQLHFLQGISYAHSGNLAAAATSLRKAWDQEGQLNPERYASFFAQDSKADALELLVNVRGQDAQTSIAMGHFALNDIDQGFAALERAVATREHLLLETWQTAAYWDDIRDLPRANDVSRLIDAQVRYTPRYESALP